MTTKHCRSCDETKPLELFTKQGNKSYRSAGAGGYHTYCKACNKTRADAWRKARPGAYTGTGKINKVPKEDRYLMSAIRARIGQAKQRIAKYGLVNDLLTADEAYEIFKQQEGKCALTGVSMTVEKESPLCLSLDQIEAGKGYSKENVQWTCWATNRAKGDLSLDDFIRMCTKVVEFQKVQRLSKGSES